MGKQQTLPYTLTVRDADGVVHSMAHFLIEEDRAAAAFSLCHPGRDPSEYQNEWAMEVDTLVSGDWLVLGRGLELQWSTKESRLHEREAFEAFAAGLTALGRRYGLGLDVAAPARLVSLETGEEPPTYALPLLLDRGQRSLFPATEDGCLLFLDGLEGLSEEHAVEVLDSRGLRTLKEGDEHLTYVAVGNRLRAVRFFSSKEDASRG